MDNIVEKDSQASTPYLELLQINKSFGANQVLFDVDLTLHAGTIHALIGENGAGKSTLMKIMAGIHERDSGVVKSSGTPIDIATPQKAQSHGIMLMHQEISLFPEMTVAENIFAGHLPMKVKSVVDYAKLYELSDLILKQLECNFRPHDMVKDLSIANQHLCEFARFLSMKPRFIILDEPTASLTENEKEILFQAIYKLKNELNLGVLYISHRMHEIFEIADEVTVLRDGRNEGNFPIAEVSEFTLTRLMVGREFGVVNPKEFARDNCGKTVLEVQNLTLNNVFEDISFNIHEGEIVTLSGLIGAHRTEIAETIFGLHHPSSGKIVLEGNEIANYSTDDAIHKYRMAMVTDDRKGKGLVLGMDCVANTTLANLRSVSSKMGTIDRSKETEIYRNYHDILMIKANSGQQSAGDLSGGNQQKVVLAKWLYTNPKLLILNEPTRGIDVGAKADIYNLILEFVREGNAVLLISSDIAEVLMLSSRIVALYEGKITAELSRPDINEDAIIRAISTKSV